MYLYTLGWLKNYLEIDVKALDKGLTEYFGAAIIYLDPVVRVQSFGRQYK